MSTRLIYAGVEIGYVHTNEIRQEMAMDDSGTDALFLHFTISVSGILVVGPDLMNAFRQGTPLPLGGPASGVQNVGQLAKRIRHMLLTPRRQLLYYAGGDLLIQVPRGPDFPLGDKQVLDAKNGPHPISCNIKAVSDSVFLVDFVVETWMTECGNDTPPTSPTTTTIDQLKALGENEKPYVSNRWTESVTIDDTGTTKQKVRRGTLIARSDMFVSPDQLRAVVVPQIDKGFRRVRANYAIQADGLRLDYEITDEEVYLQPPEPALRARGEYSEMNGEGGLRFGECFVELVGNKQTDKGDLLRAAIAVVMGKIRPNLPQDLTDKNAGWIGRLHVQESLYEPIVSVRVRAQLEAVEKRVLGTQAGLGAFVRKPLSGRYANGKYEDQAPAPMNIRGTAGLVLIAAALRDPCLAAAVQLSNVQEGDGQPSLKTIPDELRQMLTQQPPIPEANVIMTSGENPKLSTIPPDDPYANYFSDTLPQSGEDDDTFEDEGE